MCIRDSSTTHPANIDSVAFHLAIMATLYALAYAFGVWWLCTMPKGINGLGLSVSYTHLQTVQRVRKEPSIIFRETKKFITIDPKAEAGFQVTGGGYRQRRVNEHINPRNGGNAFPSMSQQYVQHPFSDEKREPPVAVYEIIRGIVLNDF